MATTPHATSAGEARAAAPAAAPATPAAPTTTTTTTTTPPRPLFVYGTLCAPPLLAWVLTGDAAHAAAAAALLQPARVAGYRRVAVRHGDYPAVVPDEAGVVDGFVVRPPTASQRRKLDDFEGEVYRVVAVRAQLVDAAATTATETTTTTDTDDAAAYDTTTNTTSSVDADLYVWNGDADQLSTEPWDLATFVATRLEDWLDLFDGMEMVGDEEE